MCIRDRSLKRAISSKYFPANETTSVITLDPKVEQAIMASVKQTEQGAYLTLDPETTKAIMNSVPVSYTHLIKAVLGNSSISVNDFLGLQVGDIIRLDTNCLLYTSRCV